MKTVFITISRGSLIRNFFHSGVVSGLLDDGLRVVVLTPNHKDTSLFSAHAHERLILEPLLSPQQSLIRRILQELMRAVIFNDTVRARFTYRIASGTDPSQWLYVPRVCIFPLLRFFPFMKTLLRFLSLVLDPQREHDYLFNQYRPDLVFSTTPHDDADTSVLKGAKRSAVRTISMPKSWDNLSKILFSIKTNQMLVWGGYSKRIACTLQGYSDDEVVITGAPQFDYYANPKHLIPRDIFCSSHNLNPNRPYILYGSSGADMCDESLFIELLREYIDIRGGDKLQVLIRPHIGYKKDADQFARFESDGRFSIDRTERQDARLRDNWDVSTYHLSNLFNSLTHAAVCINVASTLTIDATLCGTPVINVRFDPDATVDKKRRSVLRLFETGYIKDALSIGATWVVCSKKEFHTALDEILRDPSAKQTQREKLIEEFAYRTDGKSAERVVDSLISTIRIDIPHKICYSTPTNRTIMSISSSAKAILRKSPFIISVYRTIKNAVVYPLKFTSLKTLQVENLPLKDLFNPEKIGLLKVVAPYSKAGYPRLSNVYQLSVALEEAKLPGAFVECGTWKGGCAAIMGAIADRYGGKRMTWYLDSFEGMPDPTEADGSGTDEIEGDVLKASVSDVEEIIFKTLHLSPEYNRIVKGWFQETLPRVKGDIGPIALLRLDADWYEGTLYCLRELYDQVLPGGYIIFDDFARWEGCRRAVREFLAERNLAPEFEYIGTYGHRVMFFKKS